MKFPSENKYCAQQYKVSRNISIAFIINKNCKEILKMQNSQGFKTFQFSEKYFHKFTMGHYPGGNALVRLKWSSARKSSWVRRLVHFTKEKNSNDFSKKDWKIAGYLLVFSILPKIFILREGLWKSFEFCKNWENILKN